jgi:ElaB/YqjD/DUF883 family membrane-anchored ribosome-binding protein
MAEELKSAAPAVAKDYAEKASVVFDEAKKRVRKNPTKAVLTALGIGFVLGLIYKH